MNPSPGVLRGLNSKSDRGSRRDRLLARSQQPIDFTGRPSDGPHFPCGGGGSVDFACVDVDCRFSFFSGKVIRSVQRASESQQPLVATLIRDSRSR
ncbi:hypothetical protein Y032_0025g1145 [Ancylostoma ceylanicum]|uniref:Uncharacterized protein n=1 Tax=Ancylostoma ceylanicum TaxID=53326 RepID=A0A016UUH2_9BILA|nr:hypothetical protein Y032_0025g1145 [Ancylostoma ceylanicum]